MVSGRNTRATSRVDVWEFGSGYYIQAVNGAVLELAAATTCALRRSEASSFADLTRAQGGCRRLTSRGFPALAAGLTDHHLACVSVSRAQHGWRRIEPDQLLHDAGQREKLEVFERRADKLETNRQTVSGESYGD